MKLFGLLEVKSGQPQVGKGWRIEMVKKFLILESVNFDCDHLDMFRYQNSISSAQANANSESVGIVTPEAHCFS